MLQIGDEIKDYTLVKFLGRGGFGEVWLAEKKIEIADKKVPFALKFLSGQNHGGIDLETVKREVNTWIDASGNKQVVSVLDGFIHNEMFVIVSEYADGGSLRDWLKTNGGKAPTIEKAVELIGGVLDGLTHLHAQKIVHRDLKPENILLKGDVPCIADFGVSRVIETLSFGEAFGTNAAGSPHYMSPESFERIIPSPQVDIWSAGVILYEMLCGKFPYQADTVPALVFEIITKDPKPMPATVPLEIQKVVSKALSKYAVDRFSSAKEMRDTLLKAFYLQDQMATIPNEELRNSKETALKLAQANTISNNETLKQIPPKKSLTWAYVAGGLFLLFGAIGITTWALIGNKTNVVKETPVISNQSPNVTKTPELPETIQATSQPEGTGSTSTANAIPAVKATEKPKVIAAATPIQKSPPKQVDQPKQTVTKPVTTKKKPSLDDLINKN